ncbi:MAG: hypothetical protein ABIT01_02815, partial [Thermoanaerobaculia bacterium]
MTAIGQTENARNENAPPITGPRVVGCRRTFASPAATTLLMLCGVLLSGGCAGVTDRPVATATAPRPSVPWRPTAEEKAAEEKAAARDAARLPTGVPAAALAAPVGGA